MLQSIITDEVEPGPHRSTITPVPVIRSRTAGFGPDIDVDPGKSYLSLRRAGKKFAIVQVTTDRLDVGIKLGDEPAGDRLEAAGNWNAMVTHRVRLHDPSDLNPELIAWLKRAYASR
jgi:hypothetical protein